MFKFKISEAFLKGQLFLKLEHANVLQDQNKMIVFSPLPITVEGALEAAITDS